MKLTIDKNIEEIPYYPKAAMYGVGDGWVRLASNENPFPPSPFVLTDIIDALPNITRYPGGENELKEAIAKKYHATPNQIVLGNGSDELIEMALKAAKTSDRRTVIISQPSFAFYAISSKVYGYNLCKVPLGKQMEVDLKAILDAIDDQTRLIFLNNPLNPTGTIFQERDFITFLKEIPDEILIVVDEAYAEFVENKTFPNSCKYINEFPVLTLRTFSKAYALAGLRLGYGICEVSLASYLERTRQPFSANTIALIAAKSALNDEEHLKRVLENNKKGKTYLYNAFSDLSIAYVPTEANYILFRVGRDAEGITRDLFEEKVLTRWMGAYDLPEYIRVSIGRMEENKRFIEALKNIMQRRRAHTFTR
ncbi:MAG TPA: histidinol-phosphate transaminase [Syntrophorhabdaceae bacterium]|nr:histidinol-phosphate transaminase [Syntrophorhabdaceae bacterium]HPL41099.1 histidinol-phosphate transaminase [Syntrophorhabdaceae bacterium]